MSIFNHKETVMFIIGDHTMTFTILFELSNFLLFFSQVDNLEKNKIYGGLKMAKNFMEAGTEIEEQLEKRDKCLSNVSTIIVEAIIARIQSGKAGAGIKSDVQNLIKGLPLEDQIAILSEALSKLASNVSGGGSKEKTSSSYGIFGGRF